MNHFFVTTEQICGDEVMITGEDVNHIKNVLRMKPGEELTVSDESGSDFLCRIVGCDAQTVRLEILKKEDGRELPIQMVLYQGLPKGDKMETIIQKCVELGAAGIVPVAQARSVVRLDERKADLKRERWQKIAESAAKQSKRSVIPGISPVMSFAQALEDAADGISVIAYEDKDGMTELREIFKLLQKADAPTRINIFVGPEGGYEASEVEEAIEAGVIPISLGARILRTETAGMALMAALMLLIETGRANNT